MSSLATTGAIVAWPILIGARAWSCRPGPRSRWPGLDEPPTRRRQRRHSPGRTTVLGPRSLAVALDGAGWLGAHLRTTAGRPSQPSADRRVGALAVLALASAAVWPPLAVCVATAAFVFPRLSRRRRARARTDAIANELPHVVDLLVVAADVGLPAVSAIGAVAWRCPGPVGVALAEAHGRVGLGDHLDRALALVIDRLGEPVRPLVAALRTSHHDGTPLTPALTRVADEARRHNRRRAEEAARRVPVRLLFPLVLCTLPAFALLTVVPLLVSALGSLQA